MTATIPKGFHPEPFSYHQELELDIDALSNAGDGIGRVDGWVVFVPFALPGDRVKARVWRNDRNYSSADLVEVLRPSPDRVEPVCRLFGTCGGCVLQHLAEDRQIAYKQQVLLDNLQRIARKQRVVAILPRNLVFLEEAVVAFPLADPADLRGTGLAAH